MLTISDGEDSTCAYPSLPTDGTAVTLDGDSGDGTTDSVVAQVAVP